MRKTEKMLMTAVLVAVFAFAFAAIVVDCGDEADGVTDEVDHEVTVYYKNFKGEWVSGTGTAVWSNESSYYRLDFDGWASGVAGQCYEKPIIGFSGNEDGSGQIYLANSGDNIRPDEHHSVPNTIWAIYAEEASYVGVSFEPVKLTYQVGDVVAIKFPAFSNVAMSTLPGQFNTNLKGSQNFISGIANKVGTWDISTSVGTSSVSIMLEVKERTTCSVSFSSNGSLVHTEALDPGSLCPEYTPDAIDGYTFGGWYTDSSLQTPFNFSTAISSDIILYAKWIENPVVISFYVEGSLHSTLAVPKGSVGVVYTPIMVEGVFAGWFYDEALTEKYDATRELTKDINLYAYGVPPLVFTSEPNASAVISQVSYGTFFFDATGSDGRYSIHWDFGDGNTSTDAIAYNTYASPGKYTVTLTITNIYGQSSVATYYVDADGDGTRGGGGQ